MVARMNALAPFLLMAVDRQNKLPFCTACKYGYDNQIPIES
jgi:hypothetical protein